MKIWILVNSITTAIEAANRNDMTGNTDWINTEVVDEIAAVLLDGNPRDDHGAALYKWDGTAAVERTEAERRKEWGEDAPEQPTIDQRMTTAEGNIVDLNAALDVILEGRMD